ncbi:anti-sigma factor [Nesterenkonia populi]
MMHADHEYLAAGYALGGLTAEEYEAARSLHETDPRFRREVASFSDTMALLSESDDPVAPSSDTDAAILGIPHQDVPGEEQPGPAATPAASGPRAARSDRDRLTRGVFALVASVLIIVAAALGTMLWNQVQQAQQIEESLTAAEREREQMELLLAAPDLTAAHAESAVGGSVSVTYSPDAQLIHIVPHDLPAPADDEAMQMWLIDEDGPHSLGLMSAESSEMLSAVEIEEGAAFGVTVEPSGGSAEPTDDPIIVAEL